MSRLNTQEIDFSMLLASAAHDMKNSLGMLLSTLDRMAAEGGELTHQQQQNFSLLRGEASRINSDLIYLLSLYRLQNQQLQVHIDEVYLLDFFEDQHVRHTVLLEASNVEFRIDVADDALAYFDQELIAGVLNNAIVNAAKYTDTYIELSAYFDGEMVVIEVRDDGPGFPDAMINENTEYQQGVSFKSGSTNLGLFFCNHIAAMHTRGDDVGKIELQNGPHGGIFRLYLP
jgi:signal transduction histidine kinase